VDPSGQYFPAEHFLGDVLSCRQENPPGQIVCVATVPSGQKNPAVQNIEYAELKRPNKTQIYKISFIFIFQIKLRIFFQTQIYTQYGFMVRYNETK